MAYMVNMTCVDAGMKPHCPGKKGCPANEWSPGCAHTPLSEENRCSVTQMKYPKPIPLEYVGYAEGVLSSVPDPLSVDFSLNELLLLIIFFKFWNS